MPKLFSICGPGVKCRTFSIERWAISPIPIRHCLHIFIHMYMYYMYMCVREVGVNGPGIGIALHIWGASSTTLVPWLCNKIFVGWSRERAWREALQIARLRLTASTPATAAPHSLRFSFRLFMFMSRCGFREGANSSTENMHPAPGGQRSQFVKQLMPDGATVEGIALIRL